jgi:LmbE family N-acetylglucosaminyl deacetylase
MSTNVMAIAAHPGDGMFTMGAPVAQHIFNGGKGVFVSLSLGERGSNKIPMPEYGEMQRTAMQKGAESLGATAEFLTYPDGEVPNGDLIALKVCDLIRQHRPRIVISHWSGSWHKDHQNSYLVTRDAVFYAGLKTLARQLPAAGVRSILFAENWEDAANYQADMHLNITPVYEKWVKACAMFPMWKGENGFRYNDYYQSLAVMRGALAGCQYAVALMTDPTQRTRTLTSLD